MIMLSCGFFLVGVGESEAKAEEHSLGRASLIVDFPFALVC